MSAAAAPLEARDRAGTRLEAGHHVRVEPEVYDLPALLFGQVLEVYLGTRAGERVWLVDVAFGDGQDVVTVRPSECTVLRAAPPRRSARR